MEKIKLLRHLEGNPLAAIDVETTGGEPGYHEICQISIVPTDIGLEPTDRLQPLNLMIRPMYPERADKRAMSVHGFSMNDLLENAPSQSTALELIVDWFETLPIGSECRLTPLAHNWAFERSFLVPFMGSALFDQIFHHLPRDTMQIGLFLNDRIALIGESKPFPWVNLGAMCQMYNIVNEREHDAYYDCLATIDLYHALLASSH